MQRAQRFGWRRSAGSGRRGTAAAVAVGAAVLITGCAMTRDAVVVVSPEWHPDDAFVGVATVGGVVPEPVTRGAGVTAEVEAPPRVVERPRLLPTPPTIPAPAAIPVMPAPLAAARPGASGPAVKALEDRLLQLGFWLDAADGRYSNVTMQAVMAFQKDQGLKRTGVADQGTVDRLTVATARVTSRSTAGNLVEVDKAKQLLYIVRDGRVVWAVNTSTGSGQRYVERNKNTGAVVSGVSITDDGLHTVYRQHATGWRKGDLGQIYRPKYFLGGAAVHGAPRIPGYPASHGCVRVTTAFMDFVWAHDLMPMGSRVWVHDGSAGVVAPDPFVFLNPIAVT